MRKNSEQNTITSKRIQWIDIAKFFAIVFMIIGHITKNQVIRMFIFSFHMPLFIILSGYTYNPPKTLNKLNSNIKKYIKKILCPYAIALFLQVLVINIIYYDSFKFNIFMKELFNSFLWGNGCGNTFISTSFVGVGPIWFLITLFLAKVFFDMLNLCISDEYKRCLLYSLLLFIGIEIGRITWLPQGLDLVLQFLFFLYIGYIFKKYENKIKVNKKIIYILCFVFWLLCLGFNIHIEFAIRQYPYLIICVIEALCGSYCVIEYAKALENNTKIIEIMTYLGSITLYILCIHSFDVYIIHWDKIAINIYLECLLRVVIAIIIAVIYDKLKKYILRICNL